ncbi:hypothetical protein ACFQLY_10180, partial [Paraburkholderia dipogonis]|uniref:hypothetical protein n=1 Tax=Paraburkholderia dipogonis TaxID=1211383 RepID=UPI003610B22F
MFRSVFCHSVVKNLASGASKESIFRLSRAKASHDEETRPPFVCMLCEAVVMVGEPKPSSLLGSRGIFSVGILVRGKRALDGVPCALPCDMRQATLGFSRQG